MGAFFGAAEGITSRIKARIPRGMLVGALIGLVGGAVGALAGQAALWLIGGIFLLSYRNLQWVVLPVSRAIGGLNIQQAVDAPRFHHQYLPRR